MDKNTFRAEIAEYKQRGGDFAFVFDDVRLPVDYDRILGTLSVKVKDSRIMAVVDYTQSLGDNIDRLMDKLLERHPELAA